jgi:hypothetical protein
VSHVLLDGFQADAGFMEMGSVGMSQGLHTLLINSVAPESFTNFTRFLITRSLSFALCAPVASQSSYRLAIVI